MDLGGSTEREVTDLQLIFAEKKKISKRKDAISGP